MLQHSYVHFGLKLLGLLAILTVMSCTRQTLTLQDTARQPIVGARVVLHDEVVVSNARGQVQLLDRFFHLYAPADVLIKHEGYFSQSLPYPNRSLTVTLKKYSELASSTVEEALLSLAVDREQASITKRGEKLVIETADKRKICLRIHDERVLGYFILQENGVYHYDGHGVALFHDSFVDGVPMRTMANGRTISFANDDTGKFLRPSGRRGDDHIDGQRCSSHSSGAALEFWGLIFDALLSGL